MEQVWKDLPFPITNISSQYQHNSGIMFQDFMGAGSSSYLNKETPPPPPPPPPPPHDDVGPFFNITSAYSKAMGGFPPSSNGGHFGPLPPDQRVFSHDRRNKRLMKNRESASRSRARKQAYTNELELEVAHLVAENEKLRKQYEELRLAMAAQQSTKKTLQRTLTAPF